MYKTLHGKASVYQYTPPIGSALTCQFDYEKGRVHLVFTKVDREFSLSDFQDFLGIIDSVYSPIYPIGTVVELDLALLPDELETSFGEEPGPLFSITGRKVGLGEGFEDYIVDYLGRLWPFGEMPASHPVMISNMMIERVRFEGYSDEWESRFSEDILRASQLSRQQVSTAFMRSSDLARYYDFSIQSGGE